MDRKYRFMLQKCKILERKWKVTIIFSFLEKNLQKFYKNPTFVTFCDDSHHSHQWWRYFITVKTCIHYQGTVVPKLLAIGQGVQIWGQKIRKGEGVRSNPLPHPFEASRVKKQNRDSSHLIIWLLLFYGIEIPYQIV